MSSPHPTISAWTRDEHEGHYEAQLHDWKLRVCWTPNEGDQRGSFYWTADRDGEKQRRSGDDFEECEHAMAHAEHFAHNDARQRTATIAKKAEASAAH